MAKKNAKGKGGNIYSNRYGKKDKQVQNATPGSAPPPAAADASAATVTASHTGAKTLQQQRAKYALERVKAVLDGGVNRKEFKSYASSFPAMIQMNGLGQAAAFYFSQGDSYRCLYDLLSGWLILPGQPYADQGDLLAGITAQDMHIYRIAQGEALLLLDWVKRFAKAYVRED